MKEYINGKLYINGYATDSFGRPRTMANGYSSEDEKEARERYEEAVFENQNAKNNALPDDFKQDKNQLTGKPVKNKKYSKKILIDPVYSSAYSQNDKYFIVNNQLWKVEYINGKKFVGGYATNDAGQPICVEFGYTNEDTQQSKQMYNFEKHIAQEIEKEIF